MIEVGQKGFLAGGAKAINQKRTISAQNMLIICQLCAQLSYVGCMETEENLLKIYTFKLMFC